MQYAFDALVLGAGPGGYQAAIRLSQLGLKTALVEARELGGTCLNRGCIPTKALLHGAEVYETVKSAGMFGINPGAPTVDFSALAAWKDRQVAGLRSGIAGLERAHGVTVIAGHGVLQDAHTVLVDGRQVTADKLLLATGAAPACPPIPGIEAALTSDQVLALTKLPDSVLIIGGGVIGMELATLFSAFDRPVTVLEMLPDILPGVDAEITALLRRTLQARGVKIVNGAKVTGMGKSHVNYELSGEACSASADKVIVCIGRSPNTRGIGLEGAGIEMERGFVRVDAHMESSVKGVWAIGDVTGKLQLAHVASAQGLVAAANMAGKDEQMRYDVVPACVYTSPEIAYVGVSEAAAREAGREINVGRFRVSGNGRALIMNQREGLVKLIADARTGEVLGAQIMAPRATDMIGEVAAVMRCEGTIEELAGTIHPHPTVSEIIMEAAHDVSGMCCHAAPGRR